MDIEELLQALQAVITAQAEYSAASDKAAEAGAYSWDWSGVYADKLLQAQEEFAKAFEACIDARVAAAIAKTKPT